MENVAGWMAFIGFLFFIVLIILWIVLPFLIMGTNKRLDNIITLLTLNGHDQAEMCKHLAKLTDDVDKSLR